MQARIANCVRMTRVVTPTKTWQGRICVLMETFSDEKDVLDATDGSWEGRLCCTAAELIEELTLHSHSAVICDVEALAQIDLERVIETLAARAVHPPIIIWMPLDPGLSKRTFELAHLDYDNLRIVIRKIQSLHEAVHLALTDPERRAVDVLFLRGFVGWPISDEARLVLLTVMALGGRHVSVGAVAKSLGKTRGDYSRLVERVRASIGVRLDRMERSAAYSLAPL